MPETRSQGIIRVNVEENPIRANSAPPSGTFRFKAHDIPAEGISLHLFQAARGRTHCAGKWVQATKFRSGACSAFSGLQLRNFEASPRFPTRPVSAAGALANSFSARFARMSVQLMKKFLKGYKFATADLGATLADGLKFGLGGSNNRKPAFEVLPPGFAQELGAGAVFLLLDAFHLLGHRWR
jgi:hypothetical protein